MRAKERARAAGLSPASARRGQPALPFRVRHGGFRPGAGRKPDGERAGVSHAARDEFDVRVPLHVTVKLRPGLPPLRRAAEYAVLRAAFVAASKPAFRLVHYVVLDDHLHLLVEADDRAARTLGIQGLLIRVARGLNRRWRRSGPVYADRYHARALATPSEVRNALRYVLGNARKHAAEGRQVAVPQAIDVFSSAPWFDGFREAFKVRGLEGVERPVVPPRTWLLRTGWRRHGLLSVHELPG